MPNEAHEYLQGRTTPLTTHSFNPKRYRTKPNDSYIKESDDGVLTEDTSNFKRVLERRNTFKKFVGIEATKIDPLEKKVKKRRKFRIFPAKKSKDHIARSYLAEGSGSRRDAFTRKQSIVLHVREEPLRSGSHTTVLKRWLSSEVLSGTESNGVVDVSNNISIPACSKDTGDESPTSRKKWGGRLKTWLSGNRL